VINIGQD